MNPSYRAEQLIKRTLLIAAAVLLGAAVSAQVVVNEHLGLQVGLSVTVGTKVKRIGATFSTYYLYKNWQTAVALRAFYNFDSYGPSVRRPEYQLSAALSGAFGASLSQPPAFWHLLSHQSLYAYSLGYAYNLYLERSCPQATATLAVRIQQIELLSENDAFAWRGKDRFRTGALQVAWHYENYRFAMSSILWTGDPHVSSARHVKDGGNYPCRYGYKDLSEAPFGRLSHGILAMEMGRQLGWSQQLRARLGVDAEQVRHVLQNRLIHDGFTLAERINGIENPHLPMLNETGKPYLFEEGQQIRRLRFFGDAGWNEPVFY